MKTKDKKGNFVVLVIYSVLDQGGDVDQEYFLQLQLSSHSQVLILLGHFNHLDICWKNGTENCKEV